jgi:ribosomal protein S18 acetylase RimI-like enzyme
MFKEIVKKYGGEDFVLRKAKVEDCPEIMNIYNTVYKGYYTIDICTNAQKYIEAMEDKSIFWLVLSKKEKIIASVIVKINRVAAIGKIMGAAVRPEYRGHSIMKDMADIATDFCFENYGIDLIYSTVRTNQPAPQKVLKSIGYECVGILPNVVKVKSFETHAIMVKYKKNVLELRQKEKEILREVYPFYKIIEKNFNLNDNAKEVDLPKKKNLKLEEIPFEAIYHPKRAKELFDERIKQEHFNERFFLQEPNLVLYNESYGIEVFIRWIDEEKQANIIWINYENKRWYNILNSIANFCYNLNIRYFEILIDAWDIKKQKAAIEAKFVPTAYFPALFLNEDDSVRRDAVVFVRSFEILDFSNIYLFGEAKEFLREFYKSWEKIYIGNFFDEL